jgi:hypothetical protein
MDRVRIALPPRAPRPPASRARAPPLRSRGFKGSSRTIGRPHVRGLRIGQRDRIEGFYPIGLRLSRPGVPDLEAETRTHFALTPQAQEDLRWYLEDYLEFAPLVAQVQVEQIERTLRAKGEARYDQVLDANPGTRAVEIQESVAGAAAVPLELRQIRGPLTEFPDWSTMRLENTLTNTPARKCLNPHGKIS